MLTKARRVFFMSRIRPIGAMIGAAFLAALIVGDASAKSCTDNNKRGCQSKSEPSGPLKLLSFLTGKTTAKQQPAERTHKTESTRTESTRTESSRAAEPRKRTATRFHGRSRYVMRRGAPGPGDFRDVDEKDSAAAARSPELASSSSVPAGSANPTLLATPTAQVPPPASRDRREASAVPSRLFDPKGLSESDATAGSATQVSATPFGAAQASDTPSAPDRSWLGGLLAVLGGALAAASAARFVFG
jgi:hypothetical protein